MNDQQPSSMQEKFGSMSTWLVILCQSLSLTVVVFLHRRFGSRFFGLQTLAAVVIVVLFTLFWPEHDLQPLMLFLGLFLIACFTARTGIIYRRFHGEEPHSFYDGWPCLMRFLPRANEMTVKRIVEPIFVFLIGAFFLPLSEPLGSYLMLAAFGLLVSVNLSVTYERTRALDMNDAMIEQRQVTELWRTINHK